MSEHTEWMWEQRGDWWVEVDEKWSNCSKCNERPRVWTFDNGRHAKCLCYGVYEQGPVRAESVNSHAKRFGGNFTDYKSNELMVLWNLFTIDRVERNKLPEGQW